MIGPSIEVIVVETKRDQVRLGFKAPSQVPIHREEIFHRIERKRGDNSKQKETEFFDVLG